MSVKIVTEPRVYLINSPMVANIDQFFKDEGIKVDTMDDSLRQSDGDALAEFAGRVCYMSFKKPRPGGNREYLRNILEQGHGSVLEHSNYSVLLADVSRSLTHELVRHRHFSVSQLSQRFCEEVAFVKPPQYKENDGTAAYKDWLAAAEGCLTTYKMLSETHGAKLTTLEKKRKLESARAVLPNCTATKILVTGNIRCWRNFFELRTAEGADAEIRIVALKIFNLLKKYAPNSLQDYTEKDGVVSTKHRKV